jgi:surfactin synthase thioesterase subunit
MTLGWILAGLSLAGLCIAGVLAFEIRQRLLRQGR